MESILIMRKKLVCLLVVISLIIIPGCMLLFPFRVPNSEYYKYYSSRSKEIPKTLDTGGVYCFSIYDTDEKVMTTYLFKFHQDGFCQFNEIASLDNKIHETIKYGVESFKNKKSQVFNPGAIMFREKIEL